MSSQDLIATAQYLLDRPVSDQTQADLRRGMSTLYYALFCELASMCADYIAGPKTGAHSKHAWKQCYRALEHTHSREACKQAGQRGFPQDIRDFANAYVTMQAKRHRCDYTPEHPVRPTELRRAISSTKKALLKLAAATESDRRAFCAFVLLKSRKD